MSINKIHSLVVSVAALTLTACGGGGGGGGGDGSNNGGNPQLPASQVQSQVFDVSSAENQTETRQVPGEVTKVEQLRGSNAVTLTSQAGTDGTTSTVTLSVAELENDEDARFKVTSTDGEQVTETIINLSATNTSAAPLLAEAQSLQSLPDAEAVLADDLRLANIVLELEYLANLISASEQAQMRSDIDNTLADLTLDLQNQIATVTSLLNDYNAGDATETALRDRLTLVNQEIDALGEAGETILDAFSDTLARLNITFPENLNGTHPIVFNDDLNRYTRFGADAFGEVLSEDTFTFNEDFDFLNAAFPFAVDGAIGVPVLPQTAQ